MENLNQRLQINNKTKKLVGILIIHESICPSDKKKNSISEEEISLDGINRYKAKHGLDNNITNRQVANHMIKYFNSTIRQGKWKRKLKGLFEVYSGTYYIKT